MTIIAGAGRSLGRLTVVTLLCSALSAAARGDDSLARWAPGDVGLFLELRRGADLLIPLTEPQVWLTLAEFAGQPARPDEAAAWRRRVEQTVNMPPAEAIRTLFSRRVAFVGEGLGRAQDAVVLCTPAADPRALIRDWAARPRPTAGPTAVYQLPNNVGLGLHNDLLVFGDASARGMFARVMQLLESDSPAALADEPIYRRLLARVPADPDGVFFVRLGKPPPTQPAATQPTRLELPGPLRDSSNVLLALHRQGRLLHFSAVGDAPGSSPPRAGSLSELVGNLPQRTLLAWAGHVDYQALIQAAGALPERSLLRLAFQLQEQAGRIQRLVGALDSATCLAVGVVTPESRRLAAPPVPALGVLLVTRDSAAAAAECSGLIQDTLTVYKLLALKGTQTRPLTPIRTVKIEGSQVEQLDLSPLLGDKPAQTPLAELHLCWTLDGDVLIVASHADWMRQILAARRRATPNLSAVLELTRRRPPGQRDNVFVAQTGPIADLGALWLRYFAQAFPQVLKEDWWREYQPGGRSVRLGIQVTADPQNMRLSVQSVTTGMAADGILKPGDQIIGCTGRRFATSQPIREITRALAQRLDARWIDLLIEREGIHMALRVPLPFVDPVQVLRRIVAVGRIVQRMVYGEEVPDEAGPRGYLTLELRAGAAPLFTWETAAATRPDSEAPATQPVPTTPRPGN